MISPFSGAVSVNVRAMAFHGLDMVQAAKLIIQAPIPPVMKTGMEPLIFFHFAVPGIEELFRRNLTAVQPVFLIRS